MNRQIQLPSFGNSEISRTVDVELLEIASYGRNPLWRASDHNWPSIDPVEFRAAGDNELYIRAAELLDQSERDCSID